MRCLANGKNTNNPTIWQRRNADNMLKICEAKCQNQGQTVKICHSTCHNCHLLEN